MRNLMLIGIFVILYVLSSCQPGVQKGSAISRNHINYIRSLGLLAQDENIILFDSQYKIRVSGNFFTDRRIAAYWTDEKDPANSRVNYALYPDIDSIKTHYAEGGTNASSLEILKSDGKKFSVYVKANNAETKYFFDSAIARWKANHLNAAQQNDLADGR